MTFVLVHETYIVAVARGMGSPEASSGLYGGYSLIHVQPFLFKKVARHSQATEQVL